MSVKVRKDAGAWGAGAGTLAAEEGVWSYTPTQGETDCDALQIIIYKTSCIPNSMEVVLTSSASFGYAGTDHSKIANPTSTVNLSGTTIKTATDVETKVDAIDDYIDTEVAAIKAKTDNLPANPAAVSDIPTANQNRDAVLNADPNAGYTDGSFGDRWLISDNNNRTVKVTGAGAGHIAADLHASQTDSLTADAITAAAVTKIQNGLALEASSQTILARIGAFTGSGVNTILGFFRALLRSDASITTPSDVGGTYTHTTDSTQAIRDRGDAAWTTGAGGGSTTVNVLPYTGAVPDRVEGTTIKVFYNELTNVSVGVTDATGAAVTLDAKTLRFCVEDRYGVDVLTLNDGDITRSGSTFTVQIPQSLTDTVGANYRWSLRDLTSSLNTVLIHGQLIVAEAAEDEA